MRALRNNNVVVVVDLSVYKTKLFIFVFFTSTRRFLELIRNCENNFFFLKVEF